MNVIDQIVLSNSLQESERIIGKMLRKPVQVVQIGEPDGKIYFEVRSNDKLIRKVSYESI